MGSGGSFTIRNMLYFSSNTVKMIKYGGLNWAGVLNRMENSGDAFRIFTGQLRKRTFKNRILR